MLARAVGLASLVGLGLADAAWPGAWPQEDGGVFVALGGDVFSGADRATTLYLEYGLTDRITLGLDGYLTGAREGAAFGFARIPLAWPDRLGKLAAGFGIGALLRADDMVVPAARASLHWGRGLDNGWLAVDAEIATALGADMRPAKVDATWGTRFRGDWSAILLFTAGTDPEGQSYATLSPSLAWEGSEQLTLRLGVAQRLTGRRDTGVSAQLWLDF